MAYVYVQPITINQAIYFLLTVNNILLNNQLFLLT